MEGRLQDSQTLNLPTAPTSDRSEHQGKDHNAHQMTAVSEQSGTLVHQQMYAVRLIPLSHRPKTPRPYGNYRPFLLKQLYAADVTLNEETITFLFGPFRDFLASKNDNPKSGGSTDSLVAAAMFVFPALFLTEVFEIEQGAGLTVFDLERPIVLQYDGFRDSGNCRQRHADRKTPSREDSRQRSPAVMKFSADNSEVVGRQLSGSPRQL
ncbi:hypothetical protein Bbelb_111950 [Branchiostoma belcheri]|nr:hypothetical protein Bbelb_111950 [Branchiostoma belcheri]